jgi:hypothetical protein
MPGLVLTPGFIPKATETLLQDVQSMSLPGAFFDRNKDSSEGFCGAMIRLVDESRWKLIKALLNTLYQQGEPPLKLDKYSDVSALKTLETSTSM